jgi:hypothetical protein
MKKYNNKIIYFLFSFVSLILIFILYKLNYDTDVKASIFKLVIAVVFQYFIIIFTVIFIFQLLKDWIGNIRAEINIFGSDTFFIALIKKTANAIYNVVIFLALVIYGAIAIAITYISIPIIIIYSSALIQYFVFNKSSIFKTTINLIHLVVNSPIKLISANEFIEVKKDVLRAILLLGVIYYGIYTFNLLFNCKDIYICLNNNGIESIDNCFKGIKWYIGSERDL